VRAHTNSHTIDTSARESDTFGVAPHMKRLEVRGLRVPRHLTCARQRHPSKRRAAAEHKRYYPCTMLGSGTYGDVFQCWDAHQRCHVAVKQFVVYHSELPQSALREMAILRRCNHPHIIAILDTIFGVDNSTQFGTRYVGGFVMPLMRGGDASAWLRAARVKSMPCTTIARTIRLFTHQLFSAMCYLHQKSIVHRDIKPQNCLVDESGERLVLCDLGLGRLCTVPLSPTYTAGICTLWYRPPELLLGSRSYGTEIDLWSAGVTVAEFWLGRPLLPGVTDFEQLMFIFEMFGTPTAQHWPGVASLPEYKPHAFPCYAGRDVRRLLARVAGEQGADFLIQTLCYVPTQRMSAKRALEHDFLRQQRKEGAVKRPQPPSQTTPPVKRRKVYCTRQHTKQCAASPP